jgi:DNA-binding transcriptional LysR family regulator
MHGPRRSLAAVDLNLLVALDALLAESSVTRAARRVGLSQPAMSHALARLRALLGDPLLLRSDAGMQRTPRAEELVGAVRRILEEIDATLSARGPFDPADCSDSFRLSIEGGALAAVVRRLRREAPRARLEISPRADGEQWSALRRGEIDLAFSTSASCPPGFHAEPAFELPYVCLVRRAHPAVGARLSLARFAQLGHVAVTRAPIVDGEIDRALEARGLARRVVVRVPSLLGVPWLVASSDLLATVPMPLGYAGPGRVAIRAVKPPLPLAPQAVWAVWHERTQRSAPHAWFRSMVLRSCADVAPQRATFRDIRGERAPQSLRPG